MLKPSMLECLNDSYTVCGYFADIMNKENEITEDITALFNSMYEKCSVDFEKG